MKMPVNYILTTFSPTMFGTQASVHIKEIGADDAKELVNDETAIVANRDSHRNMAENLFGKKRSLRFADLQPDKSAIIIHYRGPSVADDGIIPENGQISFYLIESEEYMEPED